MNTSNSPKTTSSINTAQVDQNTSGGDDDSKPNRSIKSIIQQLNQETTNINPAIKSSSNVIMPQQQLQTSSMTRDSNSSDNRINGQSIQKFKASVNAVNAVNALNPKKSPPPIPPSRSKPQIVGNIKPIVPPPSSALKNNTSPTLSYLPNSAPIQYPVSDYRKILNDNPFDDSKEADSKDDDPFSDVNEMDNESSLVSFSSKPRRHSHSHVTSRGIGNKLINDNSVDTNPYPNQSIPSLPPKKYDNLISKHRSNENDLENGPPSLPPRPQNRSAPPLPDRPRKSDRNNNKEKNKSKREKEASGSDSDYSVEHASETPDATHVNRRPPKFQDIKDISSKVTTRTFTIAGKYVITSSGHTRVWSLSEGTNIRTISHDDSKAVSLCWRPTRRVEDVGRYIWCGTQDGHLIAIDINCEKYVEICKKAHNSSINFILRHGFQLWTLDDSGKLLIWSEGENGVVSLKSKPQNVTVSSKVNCAIIVGKHLWLSTGKTVEIFSPLGTGLVEKFEWGVEIGNVKCMTHMMHKNDVYVYIGHDDGKISVRDAETYELKSIVAASVYCINSLLGVGDYLWVGFNTGMIHIYDVRSNPWIVIKEWKAHKAPIVGIQLDETLLLRVERLQRLQVASLGEEGQIITWDGLMTEDWIADEMVAREHKYCDFRNVKVLICSWNIDASKPADLENSADGKQFLEKLFKSTKSPEIIVVGFQEIIDLESKKMTAKTMLMSKKKADKQLNENITQRYKLWRDKLIEIVQQYTNQEYEVLVLDNLVGLFTCIFAKKSEIGRIRNKDVAMKKTGLKGLHGNKGSIAVRFIYDDSSICFVNCHLAAGQGQVKERNTDVAKILDDTVFPRTDSSWDNYEGVYTHGGDGTMVLDHEIVFFSGDLNYRISLPRNEVLDAIESAKENEDYSHLLKYDQLSKQMSNNPGFRLRSFREGVPNFAPTYKYDPGKDIYDTSEKKRTPSWCDRILYFGTNILKQEHYSRYECKISDHRPISGAFKIRIKTIRKSHQAKVRDEVEGIWREKVKIKKREIMIKWMKGCGWDEQSADRTLEENYGDLKKAVDELNKKR